MRLFSLLIVWQSMLLNYFQMKLAITTRGSYILGADLLIHGSIDDQYRYTQVSIQQTQ
jgi:hypothetical protein